MAAKSPGAALMPAQAQKNKVPAWIEKWLKAHRRGVALATASRKPLLFSS